MDGVGGRSDKAASTTPLIAVAPRVPVIVGLLLGVAAATESIARAAGADVRLQFGIVLCLLALCTTVPLAVFPATAAAAAICAASVLSLAPFHSMTVAGAGTLVVALYRLARVGSQLVAAGLAMPFLVVALVQSAHGENAVLAVVLALVGPAAAWVGAARRAREDAQAFSASQQVIVGTLLEHTARGERARIARELHDVVAHHVSMIAVQAEAARLTTAGMPAAGAQQLSAIGDTARTALTEMRRLLGVLREDAQGEAPDRIPQPGVRELNDLLDEARATSGTSTRLILRGPPDALDAGVELAAYRIVQEALTNARRHALGAAVDVELHYADDVLHVRIRDNGPGPNEGQPVGGLGLLGMRERAAAVGGRLTVGRAGGGGFLVEAVLPAKPELAG